MKTHLSFEPLGGWHLPGGSLVLYQWWRVSSSESDRRVVFVWARDYEQAKARFESLVGRLFWRWAFE